MVQDSDNQRATPRQRRSQMQQPSVDAKKWSDLLEEKISHFTDQLNASNAKITEARRELTRATMDLELQIETKIAD